MRSPNTANLELRIQSYSQDKRKDGGVVERKPSVWRLGESVSYSRVSHASLYRVRSMLVVERELP
jgi:hypothetical protein